MHSTEELQDKVEKNLPQNVRKLKDHSGVFNISLTQVPERENRVENYQQEYKKNF